MTDLRTQCSLFKSKLLVYTGFARKGKGAGSGPAFQPEQIIIKICYGACL
jgi:hypothetical protein